MHSTDELLDEQLRYYNARAAEYDEWYVEYMRPVRKELTDLLSASSLHGHVLELACGTGYWTEQLSKVARRVTAVDGAPEMLKIAQPAACRMSSSSRPTSFTGSRRRSGTVSSSRTGLRTSHLSRWQHSGRRSRRPSSPGATSCASMSPQPRQRSKRSAKVPPSARATPAQGRARVHYREGILGARGVGGRTRSPRLELFLQGGRERFCILHRDSASAGVTHHPTMSTCPANPARTPVDRAAFTFPLAARPHRVNAPSPQTAFLVIDARRGSVSAAKEQECSNARSAFSRPIPAVCLGQTPS